MTALCSPSLPNHHPHPWNTYRHSMTVVQPKVHPLVPLTPPYSPYSKQQMHQQMVLPPLARLDLPITPRHSPPIASRQSVFQSIKSTLPPAAPQLVDWLDSPQHRSSHFIAEKTCEMICYLWFASPSSQPPMNNMQFAATIPFVSFMQKLLETTQVSQSVIVLSLHYIYRLKERNRFATAQPGSEFRIAVAGLIMANKFLDDNTYTNKTWSEVSGIGLQEINRMEREFLAGVGHQLYVDKPTYESWMTLLKGLVHAKDRDTQRWRLGRSTKSRPSSLTGRVLSHPTRPATYRSRSTSPSRYRVAVAPTHVLSVVHPQRNISCAHYEPAPGSKRSADSAFSPKQSEPPSKRPSLIIPRTPPTKSRATPSPLEGLGSFSRLSIGGSASSPSYVEPRTLASAYRQDDAARRSQPQNLTYHQLSCSPLERDAADAPERWRKCRLRYHHPQSRTPITLPPLVVPYQIHSAHTSPCSRRSPQLHHYYRGQQPPLPPQLPSTMDVDPTSIPFANNGPPGVHFYRPYPSCPPPVAYSGHDFTRSY